MAGILCTAGLSLSRGVHLRWRLVESLERSEFLDLARLQCDIRDVEARILYVLDGIEFRGVEPARYSRKRASQGPTRGVVSRKP